MNLPGAVILNLIVARCNLGDAPSNSLFQDGFPTSNQAHVRRDRFCYFAFNIRALYLTLQTTKDNQALTKILSS